MELFTCKARSSVTSDPQDCGWPTCGCDPYADKVLAALEESGAVVDRAEHDRRVTELLKANNREVERRRDIAAEVEFWRQEQGAKLETYMALAAAAERRGLPDEAGIYRSEIRTILNAFREADAKEWHERCAECREFILPGSLTVRVGDEDGSETAHASCFSLTEGFPEPSFNVDEIVRRAQVFMQEDTAHA